MQPPSTIAVLKSLYWSCQRDHYRKSHIIFTIISFTYQYIKFKVSNFLSPKRALVALALVEHMGDIAAAEPMARRARKHFPTAKILWIVRAPYKSLPEAYPDVDGVLVVKCHTEWLLLWSSGIFDDVWDMHLSERQCPHCGVGFRKSEIADLTFDNYYNKGCLADTQAMSAGLEPMDCPPLLISSQATISSVDDLNLPSRIIVFHAASNDTERDWQDEKWRALIEHLLIAFDGCIIEIGVTSRIFRDTSDRRMNLCGVLTILQTAEVIRRAVIFIGIDSGPAHLANAVETPGVIIMGNYRAFRNHMPYSGFYAKPLGATVLHADGPASVLSEDLVIKEIDHRLSIAVS